MILTTSPEHNDPTTVATNSREIKKVIKKNLIETASLEALNGLDFKLHDFGARGSHSHESAAIGGAAHLVNFFGSDTIEATELVMDYYNADVGLESGVSVPATEHSVSTAYGPDNEDGYLENHIDKCLENGLKIISVVSDTYDIYNFVENVVGGKLKEKVIGLGDVGATLVIRPDSGDPTVVPVDVIQILMETFGYTVNYKGFKVLPSYIRVIQGDGICKESIEAILSNMKSLGISGENIVFGMGGKLLGAPQRDDFKFAMKASDITINGVRHAVAKDPITDKGKKSKKGKFAVVRNEKGGLTTIALEDDVNGENLLRPVFKDGEILVEDNFSDIRKRAVVLG